MVHEILNKMKLITVNHKECGLEEREKFVQNSYRKKVEKLFNEKKIYGFVILETCLRVEIYFEISIGNSLDEIMNLLEIEKANTSYGIDALKHLLNVTCGLESVIKGEDQILAQMKKSYFDSLENKTSSKLLNVIFNKAIETGKKFRTESKINQQNLSLDAIAVKFIKNQFENFESKRVFLIGVGELSQSILKILHDMGIKNISVTNRTSHKAKTITIEYADVELINYAGLNEHIKESDIIISATSAPHLVVRKDKVMEYISDGKERFFLDLAVPRDIDPELMNQPNITLYHLDDIWETYNENMEKREDISNEYLYIIENQIENTLKKLSYGL